MQPYCPLCGLKLDRKWFTGGLTKGPTIDVARISVECPNCQTQVNITAGMWSQRELSNQKALDRVKALGERLDEIEAEPDDDDYIDAEIIDIIEETPKELE